MRYSDSWELLIPLVLLVVAPAVGHAQGDFGDDTGRPTNDGDWDGPSFKGLVMATKPLEGYRRHDSTDSFTRFEQGRIQVCAGSVGAAVQLRDVARENWSTPAYSKAATPADLSGCLKQGADPRGAGAFDWHSVPILVLAGQSSSLVQTPVGPVTGWSTQIGVSVADL